MNTTKKTLTKTLKLDTVHVEHVQVMSQGLKELKPSANTATRGFLKTCIYRLTVICNAAPVAKFEGTRHERVTFSVAGDHACQTARVASYAHPCCGNPTWGVENTINRSPRIPRPDTGTFNQGRHICRTEKQYRETIRQPRNMVWQVIRSRHGSTRMAAQRH